MAYGKGDQPMMYTHVPRPVSENLTVMRRRATPLKMKAFPVTFTLTEACRIMPTRQPGLSNCAEDPLSQAARRVVSWKPAHWYRRCPALDAMR